MKTPTLPIADRVGRAVAELAIIVAGVLIALAAQSWWETRGEARERVQAFAALDADLEEVERQLRSDSVLASGMASAMLRVIEGEDLTTASDSVHIATLYQTFWDHMGDGEFPFPSYRDLEGSGRLRLLPDSIRRALTRFDYTLRTLRNAFQDLQDIQEYQIDAFVAEEFDGRRFFWRPDVGWESPGRPDLAPAVGRRGRTLAAMKRDVVLYTAGMLEEARGEVRSLRGMLGDHANPRRPGRETGPDPERPDPVRDSASGR